MQNRLQEAIEHIRAEHTDELPLEEIMDMPDCGAHPVGLDLVMAAQASGEFNDAETRTALDAFGPDCADMVNGGWAPRADGATKLVVHEALVPIAQALRSHGG